MDKHYLTRFAAGNLDIGETFYLTMKLRYYYKDIEDAFGATAYKQLA